MTSYSALSDYQRCPMLYRYKYVLNLEPIAKEPNLVEGVGVHEILKTFFLGLQAGDSRSEAWDKVLTMYDEFLDVAKDWAFEDELMTVEDVLEEALWLAEEYTKRPQVQEWEILHVEEEFVMDLGGYRITFTPDLVVRDKNGYVWIVDHKTTGRLPQHGVPFGEYQALLYYAGVKDMYPELQGFIFNRIRKKIPTQPRLAKTGKTRVAYLNSIDTTYEILRDFIQEKAPGLMDEPSHKRRLAELRDGPDRFFWEDTVYVTDEEVESVTDDAYWVAQLIELSKKGDYYPRYFKETNGWDACSRCAYKTICSAELLDLNVDEALSFYQERPEKNPYEGEEDGN